MAEHLPCVYGYARISYAEGYKAGDSIESQSNRIKAYYDQYLPMVPWKGVMDDGKNVSAYKVHFANRPAGKKLLLALKKGDHLIVDKVDRIWRSIEDFVGLTKTLEKKGVTLHIVSFLGQSISSDTPLGSFVLKQFVLVSELDSAIKSERTKQALVDIAAKGVSPLSSATLPIGTMLVRIPGYKKSGKPNVALAWDPKKRAVMKYIVSVRVCATQTWERSCDDIEAFEAGVYGRAIRPREEYIKDGRTKAAPHHTPRWLKLYQAELGIQYLNIQKPTDMLPYDLLWIASKQYKVRVRQELDRLLGKIDTPALRTPLIPPEDILAMKTRSY